LLEVNCVTSTKLSTAIAGKNVALEQVCRSYLPWPQTTVP
jgi:hypothetical protein